MPVLAVDVHGAVGAHEARGGEVGDVFGEGVLGADGGDATFGGFARFGEGVVARVEVLALLCSGKAGVSGVDWGRER